MGCDPKAWGWIPPGRVQPWQPCMHGKKFSRQLTRNQMSLINPGPEKSGSNQRHQIDQPTGITWLYRLQLSFPSELSWEQMVRFSRLVFGTLLRSILLSLAVWVDAGRRAFAEHNYGEAQWNFGLNIRRHWMVVLTPEIKLSSTRSHEKPLPGPDHPISVFSR